MRAHRVLAGSATVAVALVAMATPAAAEATLAITGDPQPTPPGGATTITVEVAPTTDTDVTFDPAVRVSSSSTDVTLSVDSFTPGLDPCTVAANTVTCTPAGLPVSAGVQTLVVALAVGPTASPGPVTITARYTQLSADASQDTSVLDITPPPPPTTPTTGTTTTTTGPGTVTSIAAGSGSRGGSTGGQLPRTGSSTPLLVTLGVVLAMSGTALVLARNHRHGATPPR